jgi:phosphoribosyl-ATP pyrophosphohydrolase/phosphoribosyl-AMP cyclohydrolase
VSTREGEIRWDERGLVPAVAQDARTGQVRMVAWMNQEAYDLTRSTGFAHYWSRSRQALWKKGETSGALQRVVEVRLDCDRDTVLVRVEQEGGGACHTRKESCFFEAPEGPLEGCPVDPESVPERLFELLRARRGADPQESWTARLLADGPARIGAKVEEEAAELARAIAEETSGRVAAEAADVVYHLMVGLVARDVAWGEVVAVLGGRLGRSGIAEKASRGGGKG